jgi:hypothetical protein
MSKVKIQYDGQLPGRKFSNVSVYEFFSYEKTLFYKLTYQKAVRIEDSQVVHFDDNDLVYNIEVDIKVKFI